jgi:hypothetical protein
VVSDHELPTHIDPARAIRASDAERRLTISRLQDACVEGRLSLDEYGQRVESAFAARTRPQLELLTQDLPSHESRASEGVPRAATGSAVRTVPVSKTIAVLGTSQRSGFWRLAEVSRVFACLGSCKLDLRSARVSGPRTDISIGAVIGNVEIIVPTGVEIELEAHAVLGARDVRISAAAPASGAPVIRISGIVLLGSLTIRDAAAPVAHLDVLS